MRVLITGGAGFIGSHLTDKLLERGDKVMVIDNFATGRKENLTSHENLLLAEGTIADRDFVYSIFNDFKPEVVVHAAASYKDPDNWEEDVKTNTLGGAIVSQASAQHNVKRIIYYQTALCYGVRPLEQPITLNHPLRPFESSYAISKTAAEHYIALSGVDFISFRLANVYGPRNLSGPIPTFFKRLSAGQKCYVMDTRRDFVFIDDLIDISLRAIDGEGKPGYYHVSSGKDHAIKELFELVVEAMGIELEEEVEIRHRNPDDAYTILLDPSETEREFHWRPMVPLSEGIKKAVQWYKIYGVPDTYTHLRIHGDKK